MALARERCGTRSITPTQVFAQRCKGQISHQVQRSKLNTSFKCSISNYMQCLSVWQSWLLNTIINCSVRISQDAWGEACIAFGRWEAAVAVAAITGRHNAGEVRSPGGLLRQMIKLYGKNELRLDRTLRGLAARLTL